MLEGLVAWVLNNYLGKYVENLNTDQLSIAILSGEVELENLPLRRDALRHLGIPVEIRAGHIGKIKLQIPIRSLRSSPWVIVIERLYLVAGPLALDEWDQAAEELADQERKLAALDAIEACWRLEADGTVTPGSTAGGTYYASSYSSWLSYGTGVITDIVENMQLHVKDVHIRYEDATSLPGGAACACGLTIESLSAQSCDSSWQPQFTSHRDGSDLSFKTIELRNLAVYWDTVDPRTDHGLTSKLPPNELAAALCRSAEDRRFLVAPVSACARLQRNRNELPLRSAATPRIVCDLNLDQVPLTLVDWQYEQMVCCIRGLEFLSRVQQQRRQRPSVTVATDPKCWWLYAIGCHVPSVSRHGRCARTWPECLLLAKQNVQYVDMYTRYLAQPSAALGAETKRLKDTVEWSRDFDELRALREVAMRRVSLTTPSASTPIFSPPTSPIPAPPPPLPPPQQSTHQTDDGRSVLVRWFPQWWGWYSTPTKPENENTGTNTTTGSHQLEDEILEALADSAKNNTLLRRDVVFGKFNFTLNGGTFELCASNEIGAAGVAMIELQFTELEAGIVSRPRSSSHGIELRLGSLCLRDRLTAGTLFPVLVGPPGARESRPGVGITPVGLSFHANVPRGQRCRQQHHSIRTPGSGGKSVNDDEGGPLFSLLYEAAGSGVRRLHVRSRPIDVVYQPAVARWLVEFACAPHQRSAARHRLEEMRARTKQQLTDTWGSMLDGHQHQQRTTWDLRFDVSAPQLILVERFCDPSAAIAVVDLGTLHLENGYQHQNGQQPNFPQKQTSQKQSLDEEEEDDDAFMTPCSTPPGSEAGDDSVGDKISVLTSGETVETSTLVTALSELSLHQKLYDTYSVELCDIQVLVGRVRDNWRHAHTKGSSSLHVLDRFNIALQVERRIVPTSDPMYPSVTLAANLPRLVAHVNEQKISALRTLARVISDTSLPSPFNAASPAHHEPSATPRPISTPQSEDFPSISTPRATSPNSQDPDEISSTSSSSEPYRLLTVQFTVDQMSLEVQSRGRSVVELQVSGVTAALHRRPFDLSISLTVHGLLLVDALQTFGPDFELLVASHRHVGMDSMSGSLRDSEPTSPTSPGSPDPGSTPRQPRATSPIALTKALSAVVSPQPPLPPLLHAVDNEALISVEFVIVTGKEEAIQLATIQFNNLDIIANQETIVELVGFVRRVSPVSRSRPVPPPQPPSGVPTSNYPSRERTTSTSKSDEVDGIGTTSTPENTTRKQTTRTELTFDFHRLNVLLLRGTIEDGRSVGRKIGTATMCEARIQATVDSALFVRGSLGGLQVLDLTPEGHLHQRIISVGRDPLADETVTGFNFNTLGVQDPRHKHQHQSAELDTDQTAFSFSVRRELNCDFDDEQTVPEPVDVSIRMASVWYTHSPQFLSELRSCATEFKQYLADVARSIRSAATDVALGLVHARTEALAHSLYMNPRLAGLTAYDIQSPRRSRRRSTSTSEPHTPFTPYAEDDGEDNSTFGETDVQLDIVFDSPVLVLPRSSESCHVLVGHLGKITINNTSYVEVTPPTSDNVANNQRTYTVEIRDMSICTLDTSGRRVNFGHGFHGTVPRADQLYGCEDPSIALPILHDTLVRLQVTKYAPSQLLVQSPTASILLDDKNQNVTNFNGSLLTISGSVVNALRVSLTRVQYEQVLDTMQWLGKDESNQQSQQMHSTQINGTSVSASTTATQLPLAEITEEDVVGGVSTLSMDPHVRAKLFPSASRRARINPNYPPNYQNSIDSQEPMRLSLRFQVASFEVELCGADGAGLVGLSFGDFLLTLRTPKIYETDLEVTLRSLLVEDLLAAKGTLGRLMISSREEGDYKVMAPPCVSRSCPGDVGNTIHQTHCRTAHYGSLPDRLDTKKMYGIIESSNVIVPPSSITNRSQVNHQMNEKNLVTVTSKIIDGSSPDFDTTYESMRKSTVVDLGSIDVVVSARSWIPLLDFFSFTNDNNNENENNQKISTNVVSQQRVGNSTSCVTIRSLTLQALCASSEEHSLAKARVTDIQINSLREGEHRRINGRLGALHIRHSTPGKHVCFAERFVTIGNQALNFEYACPPVSRKDSVDSDKEEEFTDSNKEDEPSKNVYDSELIMEISPFVYVHTKRFVTELRAFFADFSRPRTSTTTTPNAVKKTPRRRSTITNEKIVSRMSLKLSADACVMLMPVHSGCADLLVLDVGQLTVRNTFTDTVDEADSSGPVFDIQTWKLHDVDVYAAEAHARDILTMNTRKEPTLVFGDCAVLRRGGSLLTEKCLLEIRIDKNLMPNIRHRKNGVADMTMHCRLSTLDVTLDVHDYALIRGVLSHNLGEDTEHILPSVTVLETTTLPDDVWTLSSLRIELLDVRVRLRPLACVNFVRSRLTVDSFSDLSQDIDLVSRQILISDEREKTSNVFTEVLRPARKAGTSNSNDGSVQAEIHSRRRRDKCKFTVLLNNMRLMAIPDWWKSAGDFIFTQHQFNPGQQELEFDPYMSHQQQETQRIEQQSDVPFELKLNITDSEIVVVEDTSRPDTNAVILRSTTLLTYRPGVLTSTNVDGDTIKPLSFSVNHLELFSCRFRETERDADEDTALSIVDPVTVSADLSGTTLDVQLHELTVRLSYRDMLMFAAMLESIRRQTVASTTYIGKTLNKTSKSIIDEDISKLCALGFTANDCIIALTKSKGRLDDAALWLTQNATPVQRAPETKATKSNGLDIRTIETRASCIRLCLIDDCGDVDVPLAEFSLSNLCATYELATLTTDPIMLEALPLSEENLGEQMPEVNSGSRAATVECTFALDYYNRVLGGWEPFVEPWRCRTVWRPEETISPLCPSRHRIALHSDDVLDVNITDALLALSRLVHESWMKDTIPKTTPRNPFVPYSLRNDTGCVLYFATVITEPDEPFRPLDDLVDSDERLQTLSWMEVQPGDIVPFSYGSTRTKQRHKESHRMRAHQLAVRVHGWKTAAPVTVDRVGIYFRQAAPDRLAQPSYRVTALRPARLVFDVRLDGSARKLVTVRSALVLINRLPDAIDVKLVERSTVNAVSTSSRTALLASGETLPVPLVHAHSHIFIRPSDPNDSYSYSQPDVPWSRVTRPGERAHCSLRCTTNRGAAYYVCCEIRRERYPATTNSSTNSIEQHLQGSPIMMAVPAHSILLLPALLLVNLLPQDMYYNVTATCGDEPAGIVSKGRILPGRGAAVSSADPDASLDIAVHVENFRCSSGVTISSAIASNNTSIDTAIGINEYSCRVRLEDTERRRLFLQSRVEPGRGARVRVTVTAPYWIINRTGLPLVFRQEGVGADTAGQFEEHELARMVAPLLFSFADQDASPTVVARVGYKYGGSKNHGAGSPQWCQQFHLRRGVQVRRLRVSHDSGPNTVYVVGIEVRGARGRRRHQHTNIVTVSPRHQLHNRSVHTLEFAQSCHATTVLDPAASAAHVHAPPGCHVPFHWPRLDRDQLLCVRCTHSGSQTTDSFRFPTSWSGGLRIDAPLSCHVLLRDELTGIRTMFLHVEVVPHGATYCVVFSDADALPPPLRVDNCSEVAVTFAQQHQHYGTTSSIGLPGTVAHAHRSVPYAWDEPTGPTKLVITAPGGVSATYDVDRLGRGIQLTYENFIYIAFTATFNTEDDLDHYNEADYSSVSHYRRRSRSPGTRTGQEIFDSLRSQRLVLDVFSGSNIVFLAHKQPGKRSQLWRMTSTGQLQHEGSTAHEKTPLVLDIEAPAPQPSAPQPARLALRRPDPRRRTTQTWRFTADGRLCCAHRNTCVQGRGDLTGFQHGEPVFLGHIKEAVSYHKIGSVPIEQAVGKQRMRPGSGLLAVELTTDGPTRVVRITDMKQREPLMARALADDEDWRGVALAHRPQSTTAAAVIDTNTNNTGYEIQVTIMLRAGLGISIIGNGRELLYLQLNNIIAEIVCGPRTRELCVSVQDAQCDNQLMEGNECPILLHAARARNPTEARRAHSLPVLEIRAELQPAAGAVVIFKHLIVCVRPIAVHLEETLLLRMYEFLLTAIGDTTAVEDDDESALESGLEDGDDEESVTGAATLGSVAGGAVITTRYHFGIIRLVPGPVRLSVHTAGGGALPMRLRALKRRLGLTLVGFEDAPVELEPYVRHHPFETGAHLRRSVLSHFRDELLWQSAAILGSVDFLGSPLGLLGDVTEGVSGLIRERSVGALVLNVAHGLSNSAAKMTETLGDGLGRVAMDDAHEEMRQRIRRKHAGSGGEHLVAGIKGLGFGLLGGATGIFKQVYEGAANDGLQGVFSGLGKGLVGVVAKPVVGVLDLATETARAVRDSSRGTGRNIPERRRQPRAAIGPGGLLPPYNPRDSRGQAYLRALSNSKSSSSSSSSALDRDADGGGGSSCGVEQYVAYECVRSGADDLRVIVSSERVRVVTGANTTDSLTIVTETGLGELVCCMPVAQEGKHYIEMIVGGGSGSALRRPRIRCDTEELARAVTRQVNYAKRLHEEAAHTLRSQDD